MYLENVLLPPLHIKLPKDGQCFKYLCKKFTSLSEAKMKENLFLDLVSKNEVWFQLWIKNESQFVKIITKFLGNKRIHIVANMVESLKKI